jgi:ketosteroid isomerase-like protein
MIAMPKIRPAEVTDRYFKHIREQNVAGIVALFAPDATYTMPDGRRFTGADEIRGWFSKLFASLALTPQVSAQIDSESASAVEIENQLPDGTKRSTANFFYLDDAGLITQLRVYQRA